MHTKPASVIRKPLWFNSKQFKKVFPAAQRRGGVWLYVHSLHVIASQGASAAALRLALNLSALSP